MSVTKDNLEAGAGDSGERDLPARRYEILPLNEGALQAGYDFLDVDWVKVFDDMSHPIMPRYVDHTRYKPYLRPDGSFDVDAIVADGTENAKKYIKDDGKPDIEAIVADLTREGFYIVYGDYIVFAIPHPDRLDPVDKQRVGDAILAYTMKMFNLGRLNEVFEYLINLFPLYFDSFQIVESLLPKLLRRGYIEKTPTSVTMSEEENRRHFQKEGFEGEELEELTQYMTKHRMFAWKWRRLMSRESFPIRKDAIERHERQSSSDQTALQENGGVKLLDKRKANFRSSLRARLEDDLE